MLQSLDKGPNPGNRQALLFNLPTSLPPSVDIRPRKTLGIKTVNKLDAPVFFTQQLDLFFQGNIEEVSILADADLDDMGPDVETQTDEQVLSNPVAAESEVSTTDFVGPLAEQFVYDERQILRCHSHLWEQSLHALCGQGNSQQKQDILNWIFEPDFVGYAMNQHGRRVRVTNDMVPFSFLLCCKLEGADPEYIRSFIARCIPDVVAEQFPSFKIDTTPDLSRFMAADTRPRG